jgi:hypothetical protein
MSLAKTKRLNMASRNTQRGEFNPTRIGLAIVILVGLLVVPLYLFNKRNEAKQARQLELEQAKNLPNAKAPVDGAAPQVSGAPEPAAASPANNPDRYGLTFGWKDNAASCHGEPKGLAQPHEGSCNPYKGDTLCRTAMPLLCVKRSSTSESSLADARVSSSNDVAGFLIKSREDGDARCAKDLGEGFKMAHFHETGGWEFKYAPAPGLRSDVRHWVAIGDQPGNCWDPA